VPATSPLQNPKSKIPNENPPLGDCSPNSNNNSSPNDSPTATASATPFPVLDLSEAIDRDPDTLAGLNLIEKRLLALLDDTLASDVVRRQSLSNTLEQVRRSRANLILKISPGTPGAVTQASLTETPDPHPKQNAAVST
jgi:hypothetical protein